MKKQTLLTTSLLTFLITQASWAQNSSKEGLERIQSNLQNTKANLTEYEKNLKVVGNNVQEVQKAKKVVATQQADLQSQQESNLESVKKIEAQEKEIMQLLANDKGIQDKEAQQIRDMEATIAKMRENQKKREMHHSDYQLQLNQLAEEKKIWTNRGKLINEQNQDLAKQLQGITKEENEWKVKWQGYQGEVNRWKKEVDRQQKINDNYKSLADVK